MKRTFRLIALFLPFLLGGILSGCGEDELPDPTAGNAEGMAAVVNGADWQSSGGTFKVGKYTVTNGVGAFVGTGDTLTIIGVQALGADTTAIVLSVKLSSAKVGAYKLRSGTAGNGKAYFVTGLSGKALQETKQKYDTGITNGDLQITDYDATTSTVSGSFGFSMSATGETTYTVVAGDIQHVTF